MLRKGFTLGLCLFLAAGLTNAQSVQDEATAEESQVQDSLAVSEEEEKKDPEPVIYQAIRQQNAKYGLAGRYGVIRSPDPEDYDNIVIFEWKLYNGKAAETDNFYMMYA